MGDNTQTAPLGVHLVGSIPLDTTEDVFTRLASALPGRFNTIPDGETGERDYFVLWQHQIFPMEIRGPMIKQFFKEPPAADIFNLTLDQVKPTMYDDRAIDSYGKFCKLREEGKIPSGVRFLVALPTPASVIWANVDPKFRKDAAPFYEQRLLESLDRIQKEIPAKDLAIQLDIAIEFAFMEHERGNLKNEYFQGYFSPAKEGTLDLAVRLSSHVQKDVQLGYHLCYGDMEHRHFVEPPDIFLMVEIANRLLDRVGPSHPVEYMHMPVPKNRTDKEYIEGLQDLKDVKLYLGLIHANDEEGTRKRMEVAQSVYPKPFGVATECGMGRCTRRDFDSVLQISAAITPA